MSSGSSSLTFRFLFEAVGQQQINMCAGAELAIGSVDVPRALQAKSKIGTMLTNPFITTWRVREYALRAIRAA